MKSSSLVILHDSWSPIIHYISSFHDHVMIILCVIVSIVTLSFSSILLSVSYSRSLNSSEWLEIVWTVAPCLCLVSLAAPSLVTLYVADELGNPSATIKVVGHQWYWSYEWSDLGELEFDSFLEPISNLSSGSKRLLEVDERLVVPVNHEIRFIITSSDVIHSWTIPSMGVKVDAVPGRINQLGVYSSRAGVLYGQCSEICGSLHSFIPICVEVISEAKFLEVVSR